MAFIRSPIFLFFIALFFSSIHSHVSLVHAIRHQHQKQSSETSVFSLSLHPRDSIIKPQHQNYTARTISRMAGDSARVKYINSRLRKALFNSDDPNFELQDIQSPLTHQSGGYSARVGVGQPAKEFYLLADTGSDINWLQCLPCQECFPQSDPTFDPSNSTSYQPLPCTSQQCNALRVKKCGDGGTCTYGALYGDNSFSIGDFATETLSFGSSDPVKNVAIGCGRKNEGFKDYAGILGLGRSVLAFPSQIKATSFSYCLVGADSKSSSTLEFNSAPPGDSVVTPILSNPKFDVYHYVELTGITVGEDQIPIPPSVYEIQSNGTGGIIVDSGTTITYLDSQVYNSVRDSFRKKTQDLPPSRVNLLGFDTCYDIPSNSASNVNVPPLSFQFSGGKTLSLPRENYFFPVAVSASGELTKFCFAFQAKAADEIVSIIGNVQQQGMRVTYDLSKNLIGFSPNKC